MPLKPRSMFWTEFGYNLLVVGRWGEARRCLNRALEDGDDAKVDDLLGQSYYLEGAFDDAEQCWRLALQRPRTATAPGGGSASSRSSGAGRPRRSSRSAEPRRSSRAPSARTTASASPTAVSAGARSPIGPCSWLRTSETAPLRPRAPMWTSPSSKPQRRHAERESSTRNSSIGPQTRPSTLRKETGPCRDSMIDPRGPRTCLIARPRPVDPERPTQSTSGPGRSSSHRA